MSDLESVLVRIEVKLLANGDIETQLEYLPPDLLVQTMDEHVPDHENTHLYAAMIRLGKETYDELEDGLGSLIKNVN